MKQPFFPETGEWVGPPCLYLQLSSMREPLLLDGRQRLAEHSARRLKYAPPQLIVFSHADVVKHLVLASHHIRAAQHLRLYVPEYVSLAARDWKRLTGLHHNKFQPMLKEFRSGDRKATQRRSMQVVRALKELIVRSNEGEEITTRHLVQALGRFADD